MDIKKAVLSQNYIYNMLKQANSNHRLSHAYLFYGEKGTGKKEMAYQLATMLYCPNGGCLECETCKNIINNNHMNVDYIGIDSNKTMISKDQITALQEEFSKTSLVSGTRVYIVDGIDTASSAAQNSLLKFIEDPQNQTPIIGIFLATELSNVVSTIISRCELVHFNALPILDRANMMIEENIDLLDAILGASLTNNIDDAIGIINDKGFDERKNNFLQFITLDKKQDLVVFYAKNINLYSNIDELKILLQWLILFLEDANLVKNSNENLILKPLYDKIITYNRNNKDCLQNKLEFVLGLFNKLKYNVSAKNVFHELIANFI